MYWWCSAMDGRIENTEEGWTPYHSWLSPLTRVFDVREKQHAPMETKTSNIHKALRIRKLVTSPESSLHLVTSTEDREFLESSFSALHRLCSTQLDAASFPVLQYTEHNIHKINDLASYQRWKIWVLWKFSTIKTLSVWFLLIGALWTSTIKSQKGSTISYIHVNLLVLLLFWSKIHLTVST